MSTTKFQKWVNQLIRRFQRWYEIDPEFRSYLPDDHREYRFPAPGTSTQNAMIPKQEFMKEFKVKYYERDFRLHSQKQNDKMKISFRQLVIDNPMRVKLGIQVGPFYGTGVAKKKSIMFHEDNDRQVYAYMKQSFTFRPADGANDEELQRAAEEKYIYKDYAEMTKLKQQQAQQALNK